MNSSQHLVIAAFGDSITEALEVEPEQRWPQWLEAALNQENFARSTPENIRVVNCGVGGNSSREGLARMETVLSCAPDLVLVEFGGNDTTDDNERHVSLEEFAANLETIKHAVETAGAQMILITFPPVVNDWSTHNEKEWHQKHGGIDEHIELYRQRTRAFATENQLLLIDIDAALRAAGQAKGWEKYFMPDGVHLNRGGNELIGETVFQSLVQSETFQQRMDSPKAS